MWGAEYQDATPNSAHDAPDACAIPIAAFMDTVTDDRHRPPMAHHVTDRTPDSQLSHGAMGSWHDDDDDGTAVRGSPVWAQRELDCIEMVMLGQAPPARIPTAAGSALESSWVREAVNRPRDVSLQEAATRAHELSADPSRAAEHSTGSDKFTRRDANSWPGRLAADSGGGAHAAATAGLEALVERCQWRRHELEPPASCSGETEGTLSDRRSLLPQDRAAAGVVAGVAGAAIEKRSASGAAEQTALGKPSALNAQDRTATGTTRYSTLPCPPAAMPGPLPPEVASQTREACATPHTATATLSAHGRLQLEALQLEGERHLPAGLPFPLAQQPGICAPVVTATTTHAAAAGRGTRWDAIGRAHPKVAAEAAAQRWFDFPGRRTSMVELPENAAVLSPHAGTRNIRARISATTAAAIHVTDDSFIPRVAHASLPAIVLPTSHSLPSFLPGAAGAASTSSNSSNSSCSSSSTSRQGAGRRGMLSRSLVRTVTAPTAVHAAPSSLASPSFFPGLHDPKRAIATARTAAYSVDADRRGSAGEVSGAELLGARGARGEGELMAVYEAATGEEAMAVAIAADPARDRFVLAPPQSRAQHHSRVAIPLPQCTPPAPSTSFTMMPQKGPPFSRPPTVALAATAHPTTPADPSLFLPPPPRTPRPSSAPAAASLGHCPRSPSGGAALAGMGSPTARSRLHFTPHSLPRPTSAGTTSACHSTSSTNSGHSSHSNHSSYGSDLLSSLQRSLNSPLHASVQASLASLPRPSLADPPVPALSPRLNAHSHAAPSHSSKPMASSLPHSFTAPWHLPASAPDPPPAAVPPAVAAAIAPAEVSQEEVLEATEQQAAPLSTTAAPHSPLASLALLPALPSLPSLPAAPASPPTASHRHLVRMGWGRRGRQQQQQAWRPLPPEDFIPWDTIYAPHTHTSTGLAAAVAAAIAAPGRTATASAAAAGLTAAGSGAGGSGGVVASDGGAAAWVDASVEGLALAGAVITTPCAVAAAHAFQSPSSARAAPHMPLHLQSHLRHMAARSQRMRAKSESDFSRRMLGSDSPNATTPVGGLPGRFSFEAWDDVTDHLDPHAHATTVGAGSTVLITGDASLLAKRRRMSPQRDAPAPPVPSVHGPYMLPLPQHYRNALPPPPIIATTALIESDVQHQQQRHCSLLQSNSPVFPVSLPRDSPAQTAYPTTFPRRAFHRSSSTPVFSTARFPSAATPSPSLHPSPLSATPAAAAATAADFRRGVSSSDAQCVDLGLPAAPFQALPGAGHREDMQQGGMLHVRAVEPDRADAERRARTGVGGLSMEMRRGGRRGGGGAVEDIVAQLEEDELRSKLSIEEQLAQMHSESSIKGGSTMGVQGLPHLQAAKASATTAGVAAGIGSLAGAGTGGTFGSFSSSGNIAN